MILSGSKEKLSMTNVITSSTDAHFAGGSDRLYAAIAEAIGTASSKAEADMHFTEALGVMMDMLKRVDPKYWEYSPSMKQYALMGCTLVLRTGSDQPGDIPTLAKVGRALRDEGYRATLLARYATIMGTTDMVYEFWTVHEPVLPETQKTSLAALLRRFDRLLLDTPITDEEAQIARFLQP
jgi:hypothetical protein